MFLFDFWYQWLFAKKSACPKTCAITRTFSRYVLVDRKNACDGAVFSTSSRMLNTSLFCCVTSSLYTPPQYQCTNRFGSPMLATSAISSLSVSWKITGSNASPRSCARSSRRPMTALYSFSDGCCTATASVPPRRGDRGGPPRRPRLEEAEEVAHRRPDRLEIHEVGEHRTLARPDRFLHELAEAADAAAAGVHVPVTHQVEPAEGLVEPFLREVEVARARLAVGEHEEELVVLRDPVEQADRLLEPRADVRAAARFHAEELVARLLLRHVLEHDIAPEVRRVALFEVMPQDEDRLPDEREVLAAHRPGDVEYVDLDRPVVLERRRVFDEVPGVLLDVDVVVEPAPFTRVAQQALRHRLFEVEVGPQSDPVDVVELHELLGLHLAGASRIVEGRQTQVVEQHLLRQTHELVEVELDLQFLAVMVAAEQAAERLDLVVPRPRPGPRAASAARSAALREELRLLAELERRKVEGRDLRLDPAVDDQFLLLDQLVQVLLKVLAQQLIVLVLGDPSAVNAHGRPPARPSEARSSCRSSGRASARRSRSSRAPRWRCAAARRGAPGSSRPSPRSSRRGAGSS